MVDGSDATTYTGDDDDNDDDNDDAVRPGGWGLASLAHRVGSAVTRAIIMCCCRVSIGQILFQGGTAEASRARACLTRHRLLRRAAKLGEQLDGGAATAAGGGAH